MRSTLKAMNSLKRKKMQIQLMEFEEIQSQEEEFVEECEGIEVLETIPKISLNAIEGVDGNTTMRVQGHVGKVLHILIDNSSTHDFLDLQAVKKLGWPIEQLGEAKVNIVGGGKLTIQSVCKEFKWKMQGKEFQTNALVIALTGSDMVLGMHWSQSIGCIQWEFTELTMLFWYKGKMMKLVAISPNRWKLVSQNQIQGSNGEEA